MISLHEITVSTVRAVTKLRVAPEQKGYVASNAVSLAQALFSEEAWYRAIYAGESPAEGCARETLEETAHPFTPTALVGVYLSRFRRGVGDAEEDITYLRFAYCGTVGEAEPGRALDTGIARTLWLSADEIRQSTARHRSPLVLQCLEDYLAGRRYPLDLVCTDASVYGGV